METPNEEMATSKGPAPRPRDLAHKSYIAGGKQGEVAEREPRHLTCNVGTTRRSGCVPALPYPPVERASNCRIICPPQAKLTSTYALTNTALCANL